MKFIQVREMRTHYNRVMEQLRKEKKIILTNKGKPVALMTEMNEENFEERLSDSRRPGFAAEPPAAYGMDDPEILDAWVQEATRRRNEYFSGKTKTVPAFQALEKLRKKYKK